MENRLYDVLTAELIAVNAKCAELFESDTAPNGYEELVDSGVLVELSQHMYGANCALNALLLGGIPASGIIREFKTNLRRIDSPPAE